MYQATLNLQGFFSPYLIIIWNSALSVQYLETTFINNYFNKLMEMSYWEHHGTPVYTAL